MYISPFGAGTLSQRYGRKTLCLIFTLIYCVSAGLKTSSNYGLLLVSEILRGGATTALFAAMEAWYVHEHTETHDFPKVRVISLAHLIDHGPHSKLAHNSSFHWSTSCSAVIPNC